MHPGFISSQRQLSGHLLTPPDDRCFYYCFVYDSAPDLYLACAQNDAGFFLDTEDAKRFAKGADDFRDRVVARIRLAGFHAQADRLLLPGEAGEPDEEDFQFFAAERGGAFDIIHPHLKDYAPLVYGSGPVSLRLRRTQIRNPGDGRWAWHYEPEQRWAPVSEGVDSASPPDAHRHCSAPSIVHPGARMRLTFKQPEPPSYSSLIPVSTPPGIDFPPRDVQPPSLASEVPILTPPGTVFPPRDVTVNRLAALGPYDDLLRNQLRRGIGQTGLLKHLKDTYNVECTLWVIKHWVAAEKKKLLVSRRVTPLTMHEAALHSLLSSGADVDALLKYLRDTHGLECTKSQILDFMRTSRSTVTESSSRPAALISSSAGTSTVPSPVPATMCSPSSSSRSVQALGSRCGEPFFIWQPGVSRSRTHIADISGPGNSGSSPDPPLVDRGYSRSTLDPPHIDPGSIPDRPWIELGSTLD
jgi:hypothetical protein